MEILISNSSDKPIYEQICLQIKSQIMNGSLAPGEALPSMRALAKDLHLSVITVQRAYEDLTRDGFIETVSGKGSFVAPQNREFIQEEQLRRAEELLQKVAEDRQGPRNRLRADGRHPQAFLRGMTGTDAGLQTQTQNHRRNRIQQKGRIPAEEPAREPITGQLLPLPTTDRRTSPWKKTAF